jgi:tetratricopeptide (TPR) repeat protein
LALAGAAGMFVYQAADREREYRDQLNRGDRALRDGQTFGAIESYSGALVLRPDSMLAHLRRGEAYRQRSEFEAAARDFRSAAELDPSATRPLDALGDVLYQRSRFSLAAEAYEARLRVDERSAETWYKLALTHYREGRTDRALEAIAQALHLNDQFPDAHYLLGVCQRELGRTAQAIAAFEKAVSQSYALIAAREELADLYAALGRKADAVEQMQVLALLDRTHVERQVALGLAQARDGRGELAVLTLGSALERTTDQSMVYGALGRVWLEMADARDDALSKALGALERAASTPVASSEMLMLYGRALVRAGQPELAEKILKQAIDRFPIDPEAFLEYADLAERMNQFMPARAALLNYGALMTSEPHFADRAFRIGRLSLRLNDLAAALSWLQRAVGAGAKATEVLASLAETQIRMGDKGGAQATIKTALEKEPDNETLLELSRRVP